MDVFVHRVQGQDTLSSQGGRKPALSKTLMGSGLPLHHNRLPLLLLFHFPQGAVPGQPALSQAWAPHSSSGT